MNTGWTNAGRVALFAYAAFGLIYPCYYAEGYYAEPRPRPVDRSESRNTAVRAILERSEKIAELKQLVEYHQRILDEVTEIQAKSRRLMKKGKAVRDRADEVSREIDAMGHLTKPEAP